MGIQGGDGTGTHVDEEQGCYYYWKRAMYHIRVLFSGASLLFSLAYIIHALIQDNVISWEGMPRWVALVLYVVLLAWLGVLEGSLVCIIGLARTDWAALATTHPRAFKSCSLCYRPHKMDSFLVGVQLLVLLNVFFLHPLSVVRSPLGEGVTPPLHSGGWVLWLGQSGFPATLVATILGQIVTQLMASWNYADFLQFPGVHYMAVLPALLLEQLGVLHVVYLFRWILLKAGCGPTVVEMDGVPYGEDKHPDLLPAGSQWQRAVVVVKYIVSTCLFFFGGACVFTAVANNWTHQAMAAGIAGVDVAIFVTGWLFLNYLEGLQVAVAMLTRAGLDLADSHPVAARNLRLVGKKAYLQSFLLGRQVLVAIMMFLLAGYATVDRHGEGSTVLSVPKGLQTSLLESGLLGALFLVVGQLVGRVLATSHPVGLLNTACLPCGIIWLCIAFDITGIVKVAYPLARGLRYLRGSPPPSSPPL